MRAGGGMRLRRLAVRVSVSRASPLSCASRLATVLFQHFPSQIFDGLRGRFNGPFTEDFHYLHRRAPARQCAAVSGELPSAFLNLLPSDFHARGLRGKAEPPRSETGSRVLRRRLPAFRLQVFEYQDRGRARYLLSVGALLRLRPSTALWHAFACRRLRSG